MRLNGWQRIGTVASVCWAIGGGLWINGRVMDSMAETVTGRYRSCLEARSVQSDGTVPRDTDWMPCMIKFMDAYPVATANHWLYAAAYTGASLFGAWVFACGLVALGRWIGRGFNPSN